MTSKLDPVSNLNYGWSLGEDGWNVGMDSNLVKLGATININVTDFVATPTVSVNGTRYLVQSGSGAFAGQNGKLAVRVEGVWTFYALPEGCIIYNLTDSTHYKLENGVPNVLSSGGVTVEDSLVSDSTTNAVSVHQVKLVSDALVGKEPTIPTGSTSQYVRGDKTLASLDKVAVGLSNVDNTSDANKPISTATQTALDNKLDTSAYVQHYRGKYVSLIALQTAIPSANDGDYAIVDTGASNNAIHYIWDAQDGWVVGSSISGTTTDVITEGSSNLYFTENRVRSTVLTGLSLVTNAVISASDSVLSAFGKLQKQITDLTSTVSGKFDSANVLYTFNDQTGTSYTVVASDVTSNGRVIITCTNAAPIAITLNTPSSYGASVGSSFNISQGGAGVLTITGTGGATLIGTATTSAINETKTLIAKTSTSWMIVGG